MRIIPNQTEKRFVPRLMKNVKKSIRPYPIKSKATIQMNPYQSETNFLIWIIPTSDSFRLILIENSV